MNGKPVRKPHGRIQHPRLSSLPSLVEEGYGYSSTDHNAFNHECFKPLLQAGLFSRVEGQLTLFRQHHGKKPVQVSGQSLLFLIIDIIDALREYARDEHVWNFLDEGENYRVLRHAANWIDPAGPSFYLHPIVKPVKATRDLRGLAKELRQLAEANKIHWTDEKKWQAFLEARRNLVARLWAAFDVHTQPAGEKYPGLPEYGKRTAIYQWIAKILSAFQISTKEQQMNNLWKTIRHDRESASYKTAHLPLEQTRREALTQSLPERRQFLTTVLERHHPPGLPSTP